MPRLIRTVLSSTSPRLKSAISSTIEIESQSVEFISESAIEASELDCVHIILTSFYLTIRQLGSRDVVNFSQLYMTVNIL